MGTAQADCPYFRSDEVPRPCQHAPDVPGCPWCAWCRDPGAKGRAYRELWGEPEPDAPSGPAPNPEPTLLRKAANLAAATLQHLAAGRKILPFEETEKRLAVCRGCEQYNAAKGSCRVCGCNLAVKASWAEQPCPHPQGDKWAMIATKEVVPKPEKLILVNKLAPGDCLAMTAALESLHRQVPGRYLTGVESASPAVFEHNPHVQDLSHDPEVRRIVMEYPLIHQSNQRPVHFMEAYCDFLGAQLGIPLPCLVNRPSLYFSTEEGKWMSRVQEVYGRPRKHWLVAAGVKNDYPAKGWIHEYYQEVVDRLQGKVLFVQVGHQDHLHRPLKGVLNQVGKTSLRELIRLCRSAEGGLGPVTFIQHCFAALGKPYVLLAGGREPPSFTAYPKQTTLHTIGALSCCQAGGCWKSRIIPLGDGDKKDKELCEQLVPVGDTVAQRCMAMLKAEDVIRAIERYYDGGALAY